jgi:hypothetical protein
LLIIVIRGPPARRTISMATINVAPRPSGAPALVGWDGVDLGFHASASSDTNSMASTIGGVARYMNSAAVGLHTATMMVAKANAATSTVFGGTTIGPPNNYTAMEGNNVLFARFKG